MIEMEPTVVSSQTDEAQQPDPQNAFPSGNSLEEDPIENEILTQMIHDLSPKEREVAARASYKYFKRFSDDASQTEHFAKLYAKRFLHAKDGDAVKALARMRETIQFRIKIQVDQIRTAFDDDNDTSPQLSENPDTTRLEKEISHGSLYVQGFDREGHSTYIFVPRKVQGHDLEWTIKHHVYTLERAVACSRAVDQTVNAVIDFAGFSLANNPIPPMDVAKAFLSTLRNHYAGTIHRIYMVNPPSAFVVLWNWLFQPLVGTKTRNKICLVSSSSDGDENELAAVYEPNQAAPWMMKNGQKRRELDVHEYLYKTPFDRSFDDSS